MSSVVGTIGLWSFLLSAAGFFLLGMLLLFRRRLTSLSVLVGIASFVTATWSAVLAIAVVYGMPGRLPLIIQMETVRTAAWVSVLILLQQRTWGLDRRPQSTFLVAALLGFVIALQLALGTWGRFDGMRLPLGQHPEMLLSVGTRLLVSITGLVLLHNLYLNARRAEGISFRLLAVGLGIIFAYDLNLYTLYFLTGTINQDLLLMRGAVNALAVPLLFVALARRHRGQFQLSRQAAFNTVSFTIIGSYLILMSLLAYALKLTGGDWGTMLQIFFLTITLIIGAFILLSARLRAELKVRIARNFYRYRYDYRIEWLRFIETIDAPNSHGQLPIRERLVLAVANVLDCPGGVLLEPSEAGGYAQTTRWYWPSLESFHVPEGSAFTLFLADTGRIVDFDGLRAEVGRNITRGSHGSLTLPHWAAIDNSIWLGVPLVHRERLIGIILLQRSLAARDLNWEDFDLLRTLGRQGASYLAEAETQARLDEARSFDEFNRRFAFVMHDLKNVVSQLALVARNAERHADNEEFRADMVETLKSSVTKMMDLMQLLAREVGGTSHDGSPANALPEQEQLSVRLRTVVGDVVATLRRTHPAISLEEPDAEIYVTGDSSRLEAMVTHLIQNAIDASAPGAPIAVRLTQARSTARLKIIDHGQGMSAAFIRDDLFKPFRSTKRDGFGIGAFEAREIARSFGGKMEVSSRPGEGSRFTVTLPLAQRKEARRD